MASVTKEEQQIIDDLTKLQSGQMPSRSDPEYLEMLGSRMMAIEQAFESDLAEVRGTQTQEEAGYEVQRGEESPYSGAQMNVFAPEEFGAFQLLFESSVFSSKINSIDLLMDYISRFSREELGERFWSEVVMPPLRNTIGKIFTTQGLGTWKQLSHAWARERISPALPGFSLGGQGKKENRILSWRERYRRALTGKKGLRDGSTVFQPLQGGNWKSGFEYGVNVGWFADLSRRLRGDDLEADYPIKHEGGSEGRFRFISHIPQSAEAVLGAFGFNYDLEREGYIPITTKQAKRLEKVGIRSHETYDFASTQGRGKNVKGSVSSSPLTFEIPARPVWGLFRRENLTVIRNFYNSLGERMARSIGRYMDKAERQRWYQSDYRSAMQGLSLQAAEHVQERQQAPQRQADEMSFQEIYTQHGHVEDVRRHLYEEMESAIESGRGISSEEQRIFRELEEEFEFEDF